MGLQVLALLLIISSILGVSATQSSQAEAADGGYNLYWIDDDDGGPGGITTPRFNEVKKVFDDRTYSKLGFAGYTESRYGSGDEYPILCAVADDGTKWLINGPSTNIKDASYKPTRTKTDNCNPNGNISGSLLNSEHGPGNPLIQWHGQRSYYMFINDVPSYQRVYAVDREGYLWEGAGSTSIPYSDIDFQQVGRSFTKDKDDHFLGTGQVFALGKARNNQNTTVAQMPTTGAPEGLTSVGVMAVCLGLVGLSLLLCRRRS